MDVRWRFHLKNLADGCHHSRGLQQSYCYYGRSAFKLEILEVCDPASLNESERYWIASLHPDWNVLKGGGRKRKPEELREIAEKKRRREEKIAEKQRRENELDSAYKIRHICRHCGCTFSGIIYCDACRAVPENQCKECHDELAHDLIQVGETIMPGIARVF